MITKKGNIYMGFKLVVLVSTVLGDSTVIKSWMDKLKDTVAGIDVIVCRTSEDAELHIRDADAAFGDVTPELFSKAHNLKWIACSQAGPRAGYYHKELIASDVVVTNTRGIYNDHIASFIMSLILAFSKGLHVYIPQQHRSEWRPIYEPIHLSDSTVVVVGVGGIGTETARLCTEFGMNVLGVDPRTKNPPKGVSSLFHPNQLKEILPLGDFVVVTVPESPNTQGMFGATQFALMKEASFFINIGRGSTVILKDLTDALINRQIAGAGLDVFQTEPLPVDHKLWSAPGTIITPHIAGLGPYLDDRRRDLFIENCVLFNQGKPLKNVVDKELWF